MSTGRGGKFPASPNYFRSFDRFQGSFVNVNKFKKWLKFDVSFFVKDVIEAFHFLTAVENGGELTRNAVGRNWNI